MAQVSLQALSKFFVDVQAVCNLDLEIQEGEFFTLLGPSGCGKTTTLRMVAGFEFPTSGRILFDRRDVTFMKPNRRNTGMVFQNFALFPHLTVFENVAFGLQARGVAKAEIKVRVEKALELVDLGRFGTRKVTELSGGQQQRVALARAVVIEPGILLLDEPLSNLDARLRAETREEIRALQRRLGITTIYVTHDQEEALSLSDRLAVLDHGVCQQVGSPAEIYREPANAFVARFVGNSNVFEAKIVRQGEGKMEVATAVGWRLQLDARADGRLRPGQTVSVSLRPEAIRFAAAKRAPNVFDATIQGLQFSGAVVEFDLAAFGQRLRMRRLAAECDFTHQVGETVRLQVDPSQIHLLS